MKDFFNIRNLFKNPALGLLPLFVYSILMNYTYLWESTGIALFLSLLGYFTVSKQSRLIYGISIVTFSIGMLLSFFSFFSDLHTVNRFVVLEIIFVAMLIAIRLSRSNIVKRLGKTGNLMLRNYLKESFRIAFQAQYSLTLHLMLVLLFYLFDSTGDTGERGTVILLYSQIVLPMIFLLEEGRLQILRRKLVKEEWLPVVSEQGVVTGRVAKSISRDMKNRLMHPVVRVALIYQGSIYLKKRDPDRLLNPGMLDYPFEEYMPFKAEIGETVRHSLAQECGSDALPLRFLLKYTFENEITKRLIFLYVSNIEDEALFNSLRLSEGKLWTESQIEDNIGNKIFSECFELEFEYLKNTVLMTQRFKTE